MSEKPNHSIPSVVKQIRTALAHQFKVQDDQADYAEIDSNIRNMVAVKGTNLWVLMFAIIIASVGLNVNSTAAIVGAMLISPLMGPIMGIGYGIGINDFDLIKQAIRNIGIAVLISLFSATLYFLISPLSEASSELLARTTPTIWDVLIAFFGGMAGILATTRKEKSNVLPGVAIATALMPPLCTAGYGLATQHWSYFFGAFYLFFINMVFIALATILFIGYINPPHKKFVDAALERRVHNYILVLALVTVLPSIYLAYNMVADIAFNSRAQDFIKKEMTFNNALITQKIISPNGRKIEVTYIGDVITNEQIASIEKQLKNYKLEHVKVVVHQSSDKKIGIARLPSDLDSDSLKISAVKDGRIQALEHELTQLKAEQLNGQDITQELRIQYPMLQQLSLAKTPVWRADGDANEIELIAHLVVSKSLSKADQKKIIDWLKVRTKIKQVRLTVSHL